MIALNILADAIDEWDEKIVLNFGAPVNAETGTNTQHIVTITDVSDGGLIFVVEPPKAQRLAEPYRQD